jgi:hypothetical protein
MRRGLALVVAVAISLPACAADDDDDVCHPPGFELATCRKGVFVADGAFAEDGAYVFDVDADGVKGTCRASQPQPRIRPTGASCTGDLLLLMDFQSTDDGWRLNDLQISETDARTVTIRATRDGVLIAERTYVVTYTDPFLAANPACRGMYASCPLARVSFP